MTIFIAGGFLLRPVVFNHCFSDMRTLFEENKTRAGRSASLFSNASYVRLEAAKAR
jgi:hypothetical protein